MKPLKSALFIAGVFLLLGLSFFFMPGEGLSFGGVRLRNPLPAEELMRSLTLLTARKVPHPSRYSVVAVDTVSLPAEKNKKEEKKKKTSPPLTFADSLLRAVPSIEMGDSARLLLYRVLHDMDSVRVQRRRLHILYYGDSQIEGDRITSLLRDTLQSLFGGGGPGFLLPVMTVPFTASFIVQPSSGWQRINNFAVRGGHVQGIPLGMAGAFTLAGDTAAGKKENVHCRLIIPTFASARSLSFNRMEIWLYAPHQTPQLTVRRGGEQVARVDSLPACRLVCERVSLSGRKRKIRLDFSMKAPFAVEGILLEDSVGVCVDNLPLRGRPFMMFSRCDLPTVRTMFDSLHVGMVVLQFGLNVAPGNMRDVKIYRRTMQRELRWLRKNFPEVFVLVVGVTDMGGEDPALQERLQLIRREQRQTALAEGCAFWDAYRAMGGKNAMIRWAAQQPSLARPDQAHMSQQGAELFARMLLEALMEDYQSYAYGL